MLIWTLPELFSKNLYFTYLSNGDYKLKAQTTLAGMWPIILTVHPNSVSLCLKGLDGA